MPLKFSVFLQLGHWTIILKKMKKPSEKIQFTFRETVFLPSIPLVGTFEWNSTSSRQRERPIHHHRHPISPTQEKHSLASWGHLKSRYHLPSPPFPFLPSAKNGETFACANSNNAISLFHSQYNTNHFNRNQQNEVCLVLYPSRSSGRCSVRRLAFGGLRDCF